MKKIMVIQHSGEVGGSGIGLLSVVKMLMKKFEVVVYCVETPNSLAEYFREYGFCVKTVRNIPTFLYHSGGPSVFNISFLLPFAKLKKSKKEWENIIHAESPDIVLVNSMVLSWLVEAIHKNGAKAICHVREVLPNRWSLRAKYILNTLEQFDAVWFISEHDRNYISLSRPKTSIIRDCIIFEPPHLNEYDLNDPHSNSFRVLYVGGLSKLKGIDVLLKSIIYIKAKVVFELAGDIPKDDREIISKFKHLGFQKKIVLWLSTQSKMRRLKNIKRIMNGDKGTIIVSGHKNDIRDLYKRCNVLVFPSQKAHQARPVFEAGFYGKPVIISDFKQTKENVRDGYNGLTFKPNNPKSLALAINKLAMDRDLCKQLGNNNMIESLTKNSSDAVNIEMDRFWDQFLI